MYLACSLNDSELEPYPLFYLTQFLMYCQHDHTTISVEDALELIYVRAKDMAIRDPTLDDKLLLRREVELIFEN